MRNRKLLPVILSAMLFLALFYLLIKLYKTEDKESGLSENMVIDVRSPDRDITMIKEAFHRAKWF